MGSGIGTTLSEARSRRKVDLAEVEAAIKIRVRYLQAIENEEWDALPGGAYNRGFVRTYAIYLGLDGERLADQYSQATEPAGGTRVPKRIEPVQSGARPSGRRPSGRFLIVAVCALLIAVVVGIAVAGGGEDGASSSPSPAKQAQGKEGGKAAAKGASAAKPGASVRLVAEAEVWTCLLDAGGKPLLDGQILAPGEEAGPFHSKGFEVALGNGSVRIFVNGEPARIEASSSPVGYAVGPDGELTALEEGERPNCE